MAEAPPSAEPTAEQAAAIMRSKPYIVLLVVVAVIGAIVSLAAWCFLELSYQLQREVYTHLPHALGFDNGAPVWWSLPVLAIAGVIVALAITRLPGNGGHIPAKGLGGGAPATPVDLPGVLLAGLASISLGAVVGPEAPLIALGSGLALLAIKAARRDMTQQVLLIVAASGSFAAISFIFASPLIAAVLMIEVAGIGGARLPLMLVPGLLGAGIGSLISLGLGSFTGLSSSNFALDPVVLPHFGHPTIAQFGWAIALAIAVAVITRLIVLGGLATVRVVARQRMLLVLPVIGLIIGGLAIAFHGATGKSVNEVLFSGESALGGLVSQAGAWSIGALAALILFKGAAYSMSIGSFRGGPTFPAVYLGAAGGILASHLPGFSLTPGVAVGMGAATVAVLRLPLSSVVLATLLTKNAGVGDEPLIIVGVVVSFLVTLALSALMPGPSEARSETEGATSPSPEMGATAPAG